jgi:hypothetical protein
MVLLHKIYSALNGFIIKLLLLLDNEGDLK